MALPNAYAAYGNNRVLTASPAELTLMLYDGAIKFCNIAMDAIDKKDVQKTHDNIVKIQRIIDYLRVTLDMKYSVSQDFDRIYEYISTKLIEANIKKDKEILEEIYDHLKNIRDNWKEVMLINKRKGAV